MDRCVTFDVYVSELNKKVVGIFLHINRVSSDFENRIRTIVVQSLVLIMINQLNLNEQCPKFTKLSSQSSVGRSQERRSRFPHPTGTTMASNKQKHVSDTCTTVLKTMKSSDLNGFFPFKV